jgi:hypothetical protein
VAFRRGPFGDHEFDLHHVGEGRRQKTGTDHCCLKQSELGYLCLVRSEI